MTKTLAPRPDSSVPPQPQDSGPPASRVTAVCVGFVGLTVLLGAAVLPTVLGIFGLHVSPGDGALIALLAWVPSVLYVCARCIGLMRCRLQRARLSSSAVARESL